MSYKVATIAPFRKEAKDLIKKYPSLKNELAELGSQLSHEPTAGTSLGNNCYKIRLAMASQIRWSQGNYPFLYGRGYCLSTLYLRQVREENISDSQLKALLKRIY